MSERAPQENQSETTNRFRDKCNLFLISLLILFLELACIRWFPSHVLFLTFFTNVVLLAAFLGMSVGCLAARHSHRWIRWTPLLLLLALVIGACFEHWVEQAKGTVAVGDQDSPELVYFGTETKSKDPAQLWLPIEFVAGGFFVLVTLIFVGPGQELGRALNRVPNRVQAYTINIFGSVIGIVLFFLFSWHHLSPLWWFLPAAVGIAYFFYTQMPSSWLMKGLTALALLLAPFIADVHNARSQIRELRGLASPTQHFWSPYYRIDYRDKVGEHKVRIVEVNKIAHQAMHSTDSLFCAYALPHLLNRDAGGAPFKDVLIIGAGTGNDVSRALQWGAEHVDAVEIDPVILELGKAHHPSRPYRDPRVTVHQDDGRNFLRSTNKKYDLIIYALVDSLVLHSSYSNIRLESYLFTSQAFEDIKRCLKEDGTFISYNYFRQGWVVARFYQGLSKVFGDEPLVLELPSPQFGSEERTGPEEIRSDQAMKGGFTFLMVGNADHVRQAFRDNDDYWLRFEDPPSPASPNGFRQDPTRDKSAAWLQFRQATVVPPSDSLKLASDDWPFLYLRKPTIPTFIQHGMMIMGVIAIVLILVLLAISPREGASTGRWSFPARMFFLGAGFMLIETKAVVHVALLFGSTWIVNSVVFFAILVMILLANLFVLLKKPRTLWPYYVGLFISLALNVAIPLDVFLGINRIAQVVGGCLLVFTPILFAGVIFAVSFQRTDRPSYAFGANVAGAMVGGLAESTSMLLGFRYLILVAIGLYLLSTWDRQGNASQETA